MKDYLSKSIDFLRDREGLFLVLVGALFVQAPHSAEVFHRISTSKSHSALEWLHSAGYAIVLELAVLLFVVRGRKELSWSFAGISVLMNIFYYYTPAWWSDPGTAWADIIKCTVTSIALPLAIAFYSHEVAGDDVQVVTTDNAQSDIPVVQKVTIRKARTDDPVAQSEQLQSQQMTTEDAQSDGPDLRERAIMLHSEGLSYAQIGNELGKHRNTISAWLKHSNGHTAEVH